MYGLPKTHKKNVSLRPILSMTGSAVLSLYSSNCIPVRDSFTFANAITTSKLNPSSVFICSFDISTLFTNVPLAETIQICADALNNLEHPPASFPRETFIELMKMATSSVEFSFNNIMHRQMDEVAMGSPLGPALANIFVGYYETELFRNTLKLEMDYRYMDDTSVVFNNESQSDVFWYKLNSFHPSLHFTFEKESNCFSSFFRSVDRKTFFRIYHLHLQQTCIHWTIYSLEFLKPTKAENPLNHDPHSPCSFHLFSRTATIRVGQN